MEKLKHYAELVKFEHTVFALPFALASVLLLAKEAPTMGKLFWILVALISARTLGMAFNRLVDEPYDRLNPRSQSWPLVSGVLSRGEVKGLIAFSAGVFVLSTVFINFLAFLLSPVVIFLLWLYPYSKRFTYFPHLVLGLVYFLIPVAVDVALNASVSIKAFILGVAMAFWVSGFDILYSLQDYEFDKEHGLKSVPVRFGIEGALKLARTFHLITFLSLLSLGFYDNRLGVIYMGGLLLLAGFLLYEHSLIKPNDLSKVNKAFFTVNGYVSVVFFIVVLLDYIS
ncbi:4-hydroxybenzoate polyprenyltransferase [Hydrogenivirga caldilitoris]|uniref:4-hydroxybenzoate polyprenyltransferase n=1 Tax=Hydrogenivirga caldilitoris TaxID=246264 RepID=A0A497XSM3_9AQUI|nr:UbiA-like polyprenyltransferase [Hydrogenivirga caldilitoris]RLJ69923.1 4-hydroxybenzoate polyprenyltransferase [Hydrogenivirga caldilitoris]